MLKKKIVINTSINIIGKFINLAFQLLIISFLIKIIGAEKYGIIVLGIGIVGLSNIFEAGFGLAVTKYIAEALAGKKKEDIQKIVNTNYCIVFFMGMIFVLLIMILNEFFLSSIFKIPLNNLKETKIFITWLFPFIFIELFYITNTRILEGFQFYHITRTFDAIKWALRYFFIIIFLKIKPDLVAVAYAYNLSSLILIVFLFIVLLKNKVYFHYKYIEFLYLKKIFSFSIWIFLSKFFGFISYRIDIIVIGIFLTPVYLAYYNIAYKIYEAVKMGLSLLSSTLVPVSSYLNKLKEIEKLKQLFLKSLKFSIFLMYPVIIFVLIFGSKIIYIWLNKYYVESEILNKWFMLSLILTAIISAGSEIMVGLNKLKILVKYNAIASFINLIISIILVKYMGLAGVVIGTFIGSIIYTVGFSIEMKKVFKIKFNDIIKEKIHFIFLMNVILFFIFNFSKTYYYIIFSLIIYMILNIFLIIKKDIVFLLKKTPKLKSEEGTINE